MNFTDIRRDRVLTRVLLFNIEGEDYYEDLELAARLGKTLLQKNKELDMLNYQMRCCNEEQSLEIEVKCVI